MKTFRFCGFLLAAIALAAPFAFGGVNRWTSGGSLGGRVGSLAIDPMNPETVYANTGRAILRSRDGGGSWATSLEASSNDDPFIAGLAIDTMSPSNVYAATNDGLFKSVDAGSSWNAVGPGLSGARIHCLAIDPLDPSTLLAGIAGGLIRSTDGGATWSGRILAASIYSLLFSSQTPSTIYGAEFDSSVFYPEPSRVYESTDGGASWTQKESLTNIPPGALAIDPTNSSTLYSGGIIGHWFDLVAGTFKSSDSGQTWQRVSDGATTALVIDPANPQTIYAATQESGFLRSTDGGSSWSDFNTGWTFPTASVIALAIDRTGTRLHAGTDKGEVFSYQISSGALDLSAALDLSVGTDNKTRVLFTDPDGRALVRNFDNSGDSTSSGPYGPISGWYARAVADGSDGLTRVLWNNLDGSTKLQLLGPTGNEASSYRYGPVAGWTAVDVSVGRDNTTQVLWPNTDGRMGLWRLDSTGAVVGGAAFGPYPGWTARSLSDGADGLTRLLWSNTDGRVGLSLMDAGQIVATFRFASGPGWTARDVAVAADNQARILFVNVNGGMTLWSVDNSGAVTSSGTVYAPPQPGQAAIRISAGADGLTRVLWRSPEGTGSVWLMGLDNVLLSSFAFCGNFGESSGCGAWDY